MIERRRCLPQASAAFAPRIAVLLCIFEAYREVPGSRCARGSLRSEAAVRLLTNELPESLNAPNPGEMAASIPPAFRATPLIVMKPQASSITPTCETDPCGLLDGKRVVLVGWLVRGSREALRPIDEPLQRGYWQVTKPRQVGDHFTLRIYTSGKSFSAAMSLRARLQGEASDKIEWKPLTVPPPPED